MAGIPQTVEDSPYEASPDDVEVDVRSELSPEEIEQIKVELAPMDSAALDAYFQERGIDDAEAQTIRSLIDQVKAESAMAAPSVSAQSAQMPISTPGPVGPGISSALPEDMTLEKYLEAVKSAPITGTAIDVLTGVAGESPYAAIPALVASFFPQTKAAQYLARGAAAIGAYAFAPETENAIREQLGLDPQNYEWWQRGLGAAGAATAASAAKSLPKNLNVKAAEGALAVKKSVSKLADQMAVSKNLTDKEKSFFVDQVNSMMESKLKYYKEFPELDDYQAAQKAFQDVSTEMRIADSIQTAVNAFPDISMARFQKLKPGQEMVKSFQGASKARQSFALENLSSEVEKGIELAKKGKGNIEGLFVNLKDFRDGIGQIFKESGFLIERIKGGSEIVFDNGNFFLKTKDGVLKNISSIPGEYDRVMSAIQNNKYLNSVYTMWKAADSRYSEVLSGKKGADAVARQRSNLTLSELSKLRSELDSSISDQAEVAVKAAKNRVVGMIREMEDSQVQKLIENGNPALAQAAEDYASVKSLSTIAADVFDPLIKAINGNSESLAGAFMAMKLDDVEKFVRLSKEGVLNLGKIGNPVVAKDVPGYIGRKLLENYAADFMKIAKEGKNLSQRSFAQFPDAVRSIKENKDLVSRLQRLIGKEEFNKVIKGMESLFGDAEKMAVRIEGAARAGNLKAENALKAAAGELATRQALNAVGGPQVYTLPFLKRLWDSSGIKSAMNAVNKVVFTRGLDDLVASLKNPSDAVSMRRQIIETFGDNPVGAQVLANFDNKARIRFLDKANLAAGAAMSLAGKSPRLLQERREQPGQ